MKNTTERDIKIKDIPFLNYCSIPSMSRIRERECEELCVSKNRQV